MQKIFRQEILLVFAISTLNSFFFAGDKVKSMYKKRIICYHIVKKNYSFSSHFVKIFYTYGNKNPGMSHKY